MQRTNKTLEQGLHHSRRHRAPSRGGLESLGRRMSLEGFHTLENQPEGGRKWRERERKTRVPKPLVEQGCFNDLSVSIYRLLYKEFLSKMIKIRKPKVQQPLSREQGINNGDKVRRQPISQERGSRLSSIVIRRMFPEGDSGLSHLTTSVLRAACSSTRFWQKQIRNRGFMRNNTQKSSC